MGERIVLDGGVGSEIQRRVGTLDPCAWSGFSHLLHPRTVYDIHRDYIRAGAQVISTNTFSSARHILARVGYGDDFVRINRLAVQLARRAREEHATGEVWIAGSVSTIPPLDQPASIPSGPDVRDGQRRQAAILAEAGVDLLLVEMALDSQGAAALRDACLETGLPVWVGFSASLGAVGTVQAFRTADAYTAMSDEAFDAVAAAVATGGVAAAGVMHTKLPVMVPALKELSRVWHGPTMAYACVGKFETYLWRFDEEERPASYVEHARGWLLDHHVQIVGGCCGTGPAHIAALSQLTRELR